MPCSRAEAAVYPVRHFPSNSRMERKGLGQAVFDDREPAIILPSSNVVSGPQYGFRARLPCAHGSGAVSSSGGEAPNGQAARTGRHCSGPPAGAGPRCRSRREDGHWETSGVSWRPKWPSRSAPGRLNMPTDSRVSPAMTILLCSRYAVCMHTLAVCRDAPARSRREVPSWPGFSFGSRSTATSVSAPRVLAPVPPVPVGQHSDGPLPSPVAGPATARCMRCRNDAIASASTVRPSIAASPAACA